MTVIHLVLVFLLATGSVRVDHKEFATIKDCKIAESVAHEAAKISGDVLDVGTICVKSEFDADFKPRV